MGTTGVRTILYPVRDLAKAKELFTRLAGREPMADSPYYVGYDLDGQQISALNGGPQYKFNEAVSLMVECADQDEVDYYWNALSEGGEQGPCGWLKDRYGLSWQIVPRALQELLADPDRDKAQRVMAAMMQMGKIEVAGLERAAEAA